MPTLAYMQIGGCPTGTSSSLEAVGWVQTFSLGKTNIIYIYNSSEIRKIFILNLFHHYTLFDFINTNFLAHQLFFKKSKEFSCLRDRKVASRRF